MCRHIPDWLYLHVLLSGSDYGWYGRIHIEESVNISAWGELHYKPSECYSSCVHSLGKKQISSQDCDTKWWFIFLDWAPYLGPYSWKKEIKNHKRFVLQLNSFTAAIFTFSLSCDWMKITSMIIWTMIKMAKLIHVSCHSDEYIYWFFFHRAYLWKKSHKMYIFGEWSLLSKG